MKNYLKNKKVWLLTLLFSVFMTATVFANAADFDNAEKLTLGTAKKLTYDNDYTDKTKMFSFVTTGNDSYYKFTINTVGKNGVYVEFYDTANTQVYNERFYSGEINANCFKKIKKLERNHTYYLKVYPGSGMGDPCKEATILIEEIKDDAGEEEKTAKSLTRNKTIKTTFEVARDTDVFKVKTGKKTACHICVNSPDDSGMVVSVYSNPGRFKGKELICYYIYDKGNKYINLNLKKNSTYYIYVSTSSDISEDEKLNYSVGFYESVKKIKNDKPKIKKITQKAKITWNYDSKYDGIQVYRSTSKKSGYKKVKTWKRPDYGFDYPKYSFTDKKAKKGSTYYYKIRYFVKEGKKTYYSKWSSVKKVKVK